MRIAILVGLTCFSFFQPRLLRADPLFGQFDLNQMVRNATEPPTVECNTEEQKWKEAGFRKPKIEVLEEAAIYPEVQKDRTFTHEFNLTMVLFREAGWTEEEVKSRLLHLAEVFSQCGIKIAKATLITTHSSLKKRIRVDDPFEWYVPRMLSTAEMPEIADKPVFFFIKYLGGLNGGIQAVAERENDHPQATLWDTMWITKKTNSEEFKRQRTYSVEAHELGHVLLKTGHYWTEDNFLSDAKMQPSDKIAPHQCEALKKSKFMRKIEPISTTYNQ